MSVESCSAPELTPVELCPRCSAPTVRLCRTVVCGGFRDRGHAPEHHLGCDWSRPRFAGVEPAPALTEQQAVVIARERRRQRVLDAIRDRPWRTAVELAADARCSEHMVRTVLGEHPELERRRLDPPRGRGMVPHRFAWPGTPEPGQDCDGQPCTLVELDLEEGEEPEQRDGLVEVEVLLGEEPAAGVELGVVRVNDDAPAEIVELALACLADPWLLEQLVDVEVLVGQEPEQLDGLVEVVVRVGDDPDEGWKTTKRRSKARPRPHLVVVRAPVDTGWKTTKKRSKARPHLVVPRRAGGAR